MFDTLSNALAFTLLGLDPATRTGAAVQFFIMDVATVFVLLVVVIHVMDMLRALFAPEKVSAFVRGRPDWQVRGLAVLLRAVTPFCSCSSVPLFYQFRRGWYPTRCDLLTCRMSCQGPNSTFTDCLCSD